MPTKKKNPPLARSDHDIAAIKMRLIDIYAGVCGTAVRSLADACETGCVTDSFSVGDYLAAVFERFGVPPDDFIRSLSQIKTLCDFDTAAAAINDRLPMWAEHRSLNKE